MVTTNNSCHVPNAHYLLYFFSSRVLCIALPFSCSLPPLPKNTRQTDKEKTKEKKRSENKANDQQRKPMKIAVETRTRRREGIRDRSRPWGTGFPSENGPAADRSRNGSQGRSGSSSSPPTSTTRSCGSSSCPKSSRLASMASKSPIPILKSAPSVSL